MLSQRAQRQGLRKLVEAFLSPSDENIAQVPAAENVTSVIVIQGVPILLGTNKAEGANAIRLVHTIATNFTPDPYNLDNYVTIGDNEAFINATAIVGPTVGELSLPLFTAPATQNLVYDLTTCLGYLAVGTVEPVTGLLDELTGLLNFLLGKGYKVYDRPLLSML
ncbi:hypothetical protein PRZ48_002625 [Zasmidium cellare]|uniref:Uncharacterized protein n=1 Tax=Zasmidium cellare TaxID=395010 RepID=A0ABR0ESR1_ZASCE|nr:hypothetical protein PRZ48_002625 [Zasmidium cellare]